MAGKTKKDVIELKKENELSIYDTSNILFDSNKKNIAVMFSGGFDSTFLLLNALKLKKSGKINQVFAIYVDCRMFPNNEQQKQSAMNVIDYLEKHVTRCEVINTKIDVNYKTRYSRMMLGQIILMLPCCLIGIPDHTEIWFGMLEKDTVSAVIDFKREKVMKKIIKLMTKFLIDMNDVTCRNPFLEILDFKHMMKQDIISCLIEDYDLFSLCYSCDNVTVSSTGKGNEQCRCMKHEELKSALLNSYDYICSTPYGSKGRETRLTNIKKYIEKVFPETYNAMKEMK